MPAATAPVTISEGLFLRSLRNIFEKPPRLAGHMGFGYEPKVVLDDLGPACPKELAGGAIVLVLRGDRAQCAAPRSLCLRAPVLRRLHGEKLLQNSSKRSNPSAPASTRMIPTVLMLNPEALTFRAKVRIAPTTRRKRLTPILSLWPPRRWLDRHQCSRPYWWAASRRLCTARGVTRFDRRVILAVSTVHRIGGVTARLGCTSASRPPSLGKPPVVQAWRGLR
jgi:hypothetical protein